MIKKELLYRGKAKTMYATDDPELLITDFRDDTSAFDGVKKEALVDKGYINNKISSFIMQYLADHGIPTHFVKTLSAQETLVKRLTMIPLECVVRNVAAGSLCRRLGVEAGMALKPPLFEFFLKNDELHDPLVTDHHALAFGWATRAQMDTMHDYTLKINALLQDLFAKAGMILVDSKYEFGVGSDGKIYLGDEISPDSCRIWDAQTHDVLDKDRFRKDMGQVIEFYKVVATKLGIEF